MTLEDFIKMCQERDWENLLNLFPSDISDMGIKIAATAIIGKYHPDADKREKYGLGMWKKVLSTGPTSGMFTMITGAVSLADFARAYLILENRIEDKPAMASVKEFVRENKLMLAQFFEHGMVPEEVKDQIKSMFGHDIALNKKQKEAFFADAISNQRRFKIEFIQALEQVRELVRDIFQLKESEFTSYFSMPSSMRGIVDRPMGGDGDIRFTDEVKKELLKQFAEVLKLMGVSAHAYYYPTPYGKAKGIQINSKVNLVRDCLRAFRRHQTGEAVNDSDTFKLASNALNDFAATLKAHRAGDAVREDNKDDKISFPGFRLC